MPGAVSFFVRLDGVEVVVIRWWLSKDFLESGTARLDVGYVRDGFQYDVGEMMKIMRCAMWARNTSRDWAAAAQSTFSLCSGPCLLEGRL